MSTTLFLRIAAVISLLFAGGHLMGGAQSWSPAGETEVLRAMRSFQFEAEGVRRTYLDFYLGFGVTIGISLLLQAALLWQLATLARSDAARLRPMIAALFVASVASALVAWRFIFAIPAVFGVAVAACLAAAFAVAPRRM